MGETKDSHTADNDEVQCVHRSCDDAADVEVELDNGERYDLCEDHAHMAPDGTPVQSYEPNDPDKFSAVVK